MKLFTPLADFYTSTNEVRNYLDLEDLQPIRPVK